MIKYQISFGKYLYSSLAQFKNFTLKYVTQELSKNNFYHLQIDEENK